MLRTRQLSDSFFFTKMNSIELFVLLTETRHAMKIDFSKDFFLCVLNLNFPPPLNKAIIYFCMCVFLCTIEVYALLNLCLLAYVFPLQPKNCFNEF